MRIALLLALLVAAATACPSMEEDEFPSACCDCLVAQGCTKATRMECGRIAAGSGETLIVVAACVNSKGCSPKCAAEGFKWSN